mgnify:FL=1
MAKNCFLCVVQKFWVLALLLGFVQLGLAQRFSFSEYSIAQGLSSPNVTCFAKDQYGFTWIGTDNGLNRFDGTQVQVYSINDGLPNSHITHLCQVDDALVGSTIEGHLFKVVDKKVELLKADASEISEVFELKYRNDTLWIAAMKGVYTWVEQSLERLPYFKNQDSIAVSGIQFDGAGTLYAGTHHYGIFKRVGNARFNRIPMPDIRGVLDFTVLPRGQLYIGGHYFLISYRDSMLQQYRPFNQLDRNWSSRLCFDRHDGIWIGSDESGLYHYSISEDKLMHFGEAQGLGSRTIKALFLDDQGVLWIGTQGKGFVRLFSSRLQLHTDFEDDNIIGLHKLRDGSIWASSLTGELFQYVEGIKTGNHKRRSYAVDAEYDYFRNLEYGHQYADKAAFANRNAQIPKPDYTVWTMEGDERRLWVGMNYALFKKESGELEFYNRDSTDFPSDVIYSLHQKQDSLWVGLEVGAACMVGSRMVWRHKSADSLKNSTKIIFQDSKGRVWLGGNKHGLFQKKGEKVLPAIPDDKWRNVHITDILEDDEGRIWVSSNKHGIAILQNNVWYYMNEDQGLPSGKVMSMAMYKDRLVVGTDQGIYETNISGSDFEAYRFFQVDGSGLFSYPCNRNAAQVDHKGIFWIGTTSGVLQYEPDSDGRKEYAPSPYLIGAQLLYASTPLDSFVNHKDNMVIPYSQNSVRFKIGSVYFLDQKNIEYSYKLVGGARGWSDANRSTDITFNNLSPGNYSLRLRGRDKCGNWSESRQLLEFAIETPFWLSKWFYAVMSALLLSSVIGAIRWRTQRLNQRNRELEDYAAARTREVKEQNLLLEDQYREKEALLQEVHHRVKNNLQIIISLLRLQLRRVSDDTSQEVLNQSIGRIKTMSLIHQSLYQTDNLAKTNFKTYLKELMGHIMSNFEEVSQIEYILEGDDIELGTETAIPLALIAHEWVNNIYKHAFPSKKGLIGIHLIKQGDAMKMEITDNGIGISKDEFMASKSSLGAKIIRTLSSQLNAELEIERRLEGGTALTLNLMIKA